MSEHTQLGRILKASFGWGGYQDAMIGVSFTLGNDIWGTSQFRGYWSGERGNDAKWSENDRVRELGETCLWLRDILKTAKRDSIAELIGVPVEATFDGNTLKSWRVLTEVL